MGCRSNIGHSATDFCWKGSTQGVDCVFGLFLAQLVVLDRVPAVVLEPSLQKLVCQPKVEVENQYVEELTENKLEKVEVVVVEDGLEVLEYFSTTASLETSTLNSASLLNRIICLPSVPNDANSPPSMIFQSLWGKTNGPA